MGTPQDASKLQTNRFLASNFFQNHNFSKELFATIAYIRTFKTDLSLLDGLNKDERWEAIQGIIYQTAQPGRGKLISQQALNMDNILLHRRGILAQITGKFTAISLYTPSKILAGFGTSVDSLSWEQIFSAFNTTMTALQIPIQETPTYLPSPDALGKLPWFNPETPTLSPFLIKDGKVIINNAVQLPPGFQSYQSFSYFEQFLGILDSMASQLNFQDGLTIIKDTSRPNLLPFEFSIANNKYPISRVREVGIPTTARDKGDLMAALGEGGGVPSLFDLEGQANQKNQLLQLLPLFILTIAHLLQMMTQKKEKKVKKVKIQLKDS